MNVESYNLEKKLAKYNLKLNHYSECYKKMLVEEIFFTNELYNLHYGNCAIIGKIQIDLTDEKYLENIRLNFLGNKYSLPEASIKIKILDNLFHGFLPRGKSVELFGKIVLFDNQHETNNRSPIDVKDINIRLVHFVESNSNDLIEASDLILMFNENIKKKYLPAIQIQFFNIIDQPEEVIEYNLLLRKFSS